MDARERARKTVDAWHKEVNEVALLSLDPEYLARLKAECKQTRILADCMVDHVEGQIREAERAARAQALEEAALCAAIHCQHPATTDYDVGYGNARKEAAFQIRALKDET